ncbi:S-layer homology domain-containing protein [Paenibacillus oceani]|uniref:S-layer homology domain-containing protein n=1 Tax=Paenibacillus oceani TaxID=2772510 RepID=A0A927CFS2_9BACL|nr:S-layer homology domain-containing protein [Paenibacillus oceani]MBD2866142.1 S-layer homology domain-containing protein [Paenibacillus oceani]
MNDSRQWRHAENNLYQIFARIKRSVALIALLAIVLSVGGYPIPVSAAGLPNPPAATGGEESVSVSGFTAGATLKLYLTNGILIATAPSVTDATYTFTGVVPNSLDFYATQTVASDESWNSNFVPVSLRTPSATAGIGYVDVSNVLTGALVKLYEENGSLISDSPSDQGGGVWRFSGLTARKTYYAIQSINGVSSTNSSFVTVQPDIPDSPAATGGEESISVSGFTAGATLKLYLTNGTLVATATSVTGATYAFTGVVPNSLGFYATQTVGGEESENSAFVGVTLRVPSASAGLDYVDVSNVLSGATVKLHEENGSLISDSPSDQGSGVWRFSGLTARKTYYAIQSINGVSSTNSSFVTVQPDIPDSPAATGGEESISVSGFTVGATLKLYLTNGSLVATATSVTGATYAFTGVVPNSLGFYATQTVGGEESENSAFVGVTLRVPSASAGLDYVDVSNVLSGATVKLHEENGSLISDSPSDQGSGVWRFSGLTARKTYYVVQSINGVTSANSSFVTVQPDIPDSPAATGGEESISISGFTAGATLKLYLTNGTLVATATSVTGATYAFTGVVPNSLGFYATQTVGGEESENSTFVGVTLRTPTASAGLGLVDVSNVLSGATITLYDTDGHVISDSPSDQSGGVWRFSGLTAGNTYYVIQSIQGVISVNSSFVTLPSVPGVPTHVTASAGDRQAVVSFTPPADNGGSTITEYEVIALPDNIRVSGTSSPISLTGLTNGKRYTFKVAAINAVGQSEWSAESNAVYPLASSEDDESSSDGSGSASGKGPAGQTDSPGTASVNVLVNGRAESAGTATVKEVNGRQVLSIAVDENKLRQRLESEDQGAVITVSVTNASDVVIAELNGSIAKQMEMKQAIFVLRTGQAAYTIPVQQMSIDSIAQEIGKDADLRDISIHIEIAVPSANTLRLVETAAAKGEWQLAAPPLEFKIYAVYGERTVEVSQFNTYVERTIVMPDGTNPNRITTGVVVEPDGTVRHVPTRIGVVDGRYTAKINSLTNSTYSVIWHPLEFADAGSHWAKDQINNMGSRLIVNGTGDGVFSPDKNITRAEFAAIIVRGLGLKPEDGSAAFSDVQASEWYSGVIGTAYAYGLINGFEDGTFRPNERITREQAMVIVSKAMSITGLAADASDGALYGFTDAAETSGWAAHGISASIAAGIVTGRDGGLLAPKAFVTRAEVAVMVERLLKSSDLI